MIRIFVASDFVMIVLLAKMKGCVPDSSSI